jgi:coenzyme F420 hydrogenase subunit beta
LDNVRVVVTDGLCTGCGVCAGICPYEAVSMHISNGLFLPKIDEDKCTKCQLCVQTCPGHSVDFEELNSEIFGQQPEDGLLGNFLECYVGHSNDDEVRFDSTSGGIVTQLLVFALEKGLIDGALVVRMRGDNPLEPEPFIARTTKEIISASRSKYCPVPINDAVKHILKEDGRFAVVGLPCHIHGVRKAEKKIKELREKIVLHLGIMCSHTVNFFGTEHLIKKLDIARDRVAKIDFRGHGWPGSMVIALKDSSTTIIPYVGRWKAYWPIFSSFFFTPRRCLMCPDETNELADISLGDAWIPELKGETKGEAVVVVRTKKGEEILDSALSAGVITLKPIRCQIVKNSQAVPLKFKKNDIGVRLAMVESSGQKTPNFNSIPCSSSSPSIFSFVRSLFVFFNVQMSENKILEKLLIGVPFPILRLYYGVYKFLSSV